MRWVLLVLALVVAGVVSQMGPRGTVSDRRPLMLVPDMDFQPRYNAQAAGPFFADGRAMRMPPAGTVPFGGADYDSDAGSPRQDPDFLKEDDGYYRGKRGESWVDQNPLKVEMGLLQRGQERYEIFCAPCHGSTGTGKGIMTQYGMVGVASITDALDVLQHGQHRYMIYCVVCHDPLGTGHGKIVERGYTQPPSYHIERLRQAPVGHFFQVITDGYGSMPDYRQQIPPRDRWAIVAYIRALMRSQNGTLSDVPGSQREELSR